jgi:hypothetical protein
MLGAGTGSLALAAAGALILAVAAIDVFLTVFNYDGFTFVAGRFHRLLWTILRAGTRVLPVRMRHAALSVGSAAMLPATVALWLGLEATGFALMYQPGLVDHGFTLRQASASLGTGFYVSGGVISTLTFGDVIARANLDRALVDLESIFGVATFTLALGYVVTTFGVLGALENLHGRVRRHSEDPERPSSILARHFHGGAPGDLPSFLQDLGDDLESYDQGLRRYPVVYYFHTRRTRRSIPHVFAALGDLIAMLRFGLPAEEPMTHDPFLVALLDGYEETLDRLRRSFVGPDPIRPPEPLARPRFDAGGDEWVSEFRRLERNAHVAAGIEPGVDEATAYERYRAWFPFGYLQRLVLDRVADRLVYERPSARARP